MTTENFGWVFGLVAFGAWVLTQYRQRNGFATVAQEQRLEELVRNQQGEIVNLRQEVGLLQKMFVEAQTTIKRLEHDLEYQTRKANELEARLIASERQTQRPG